VTPFQSLTSVALPLVRPNIDTDAIIPSREIKGVSKSGLALGLFAGWRYMEVGDRTPRPDFVLNDPRFAGASILLGGENFGCGSSREHAVWALAEYGFRAIIAGSFSPIFQNNCLRNGIPAICLPLGFITEMAERIVTGPKEHPIHIDLPRQTVSQGELIQSFTIPEDAKRMLLDGLDVIALTLLQADEIEAFGRRDRALRPWAYLPEESSTGQNQAPQ